jgi:C-terminal processing protease CtpA/Prc
MKVLLLDNEVLLKEDFDIGSSVIPKGSQILSIDSIGIDHIVDRMTKYHRGADGDNHYPERLWAVRTFTDGYARFFGLKDKFVINIINGKTGKNQTYSIDAIPPNALREINKEENKTYSPVTFKTVDNGKIGLITMTSFSNKSFFKKSKKKINRAFKELRTKNIDKLILDIRNNGGGAISNIEHLTRQLIDEEYLIIKESSFKKAYLDMKKSFFQKILLGLAKKEIKGDDVYFNTWSKKKIKPKKKAYSGDLMVLINGQSYSAAAMTPALLKDHKRGTIIGEEAGGSYHLAFAGVSKYVTLKNSKLKIRVPVISLVYDVEETKQDRRDGVVPDIVKKYTKEDLINGTDTVLEYAIEYLNNLKT